jgi:hypothetical protein
MEGRVAETQMTSAPNKRPRLTPLDRLINTSLGGTMKQRVIVTRHGKKYHRLKVEDTVILTHVRLAPAQGKVITATSLGEDLLIGRKAAERGLKRLAKLGLIFAKQKEGKEVYYENPEGYSYPPRLIDDIIELGAYQIVQGRQLEKMVARLDDQVMKDRSAKAIEAVTLNVF